MSDEIETPITWLLNHLSNTGQDDLIAEYHSRRKIYQNQLQRRNKQRSLEDAEKQRKLREAEEAEWKRFVL